MKNKRIQIPVLLSSSESIEQELREIFVERIAKLMKRIEQELVFGRGFSFENGSPEAYAEKMLAYAGDINIIALNLRDNINSIRKEMEKEIQNG